MAIMVNRAVLAHRLFTGLSRSHLACLAHELAEPWQARVEGRRHATRGGARKRAAGAGARHQLVSVDRLEATLIHLRHDLPHSVLGLLFGVARSTVTRAIGEVRTLLAERGCAVPGLLGLRLRTLTDVCAYAQAEGVELRLDATEIQVRRLPVGRGGRRAFVAGKKKQNTMKATVIADDQGRTLWTDPLRPGRMHDATAARNEGIAVCFRHFPEVGILLDDGYLGLSRDHRGQAITRPRKPRLRSRTSCPFRGVDGAGLGPGVVLAHPRYADLPPANRSASSWRGGRSAALAGLQVRPTQAAVMVAVVPTRRR